MAPYPSLSYNTTGYAFFPRQPAWHTLPIDNARFHKLPYARKHMRAVKCHTYGGCPPCRIRILSQILVVILVKRWIEGTPSPIRKCFRCLPLVFVWFHFFAGVR